jgi:preprotein translocase subunit SecA
MVGSPSQNAGNGSYASFFFHISMRDLALDPIGLPVGAYAERRRPSEGRVEQACARLIGPALRRFHARSLETETFVAAVGARRGLQALKVRELRLLADDLRIRLRQGSWSLELAAETFAVIRETAGKVLGMRPFDVQVRGGWILLNGMVAEMDTGEGKTLTATLPAATVALAGLPVHVVTVNDYLAQRDAGLMRPLYDALGLRVGVVTSGMSHDARRQAYACDITYCTNKELVFDYLRDRIAMGPRSGHIRLKIARLAQPSSRAAEVLLRGLHFAIVDEADSVMIDEARTPLIISKASDAVGDAGEYRAALSVAAELAYGSDFTVDARDRLILLTESGRSKLLETLQLRAGPSQSRWRREEMVRQALSALHLMQRDTHYLVKDGRVQIVDESTGRTMADRSWEHGLHQLIEIKEGCALTAPNDPLSRISYQHFFRRYRRLAGMTGTAREVQNELWSIYRLAVVRVPTHRPPRRRHLGNRVYPTLETKWQAVVSRIIELRDQRRPILVGTRSVAASEHLSGLLSAIGVPHQVLNARQDEAEALIIAQAGALGQITVATNMAGRGTDIRLAAGVAERGGLHVIGTEPHESGRIDRQLWGRCGRQGDPGSYEMFMSLDDEVIRLYGSGLSRFGALCRYEGIAARFWKLALSWCQSRAEHWYERARRDLLKLDEQLEAALAYTGHFE